MESGIVRRAIKLGIMAIACLCLFVTPATPQQGDKVLLIIRDAKSATSDALEWTITKEAGVMKEMLQKAGFAVEMASPTGEPWGKPPNVLKPDLKLSAVKVDDYKGFVIPCLAIDSDKLHPDLAAVIKGAVKAGKPVAAQAGGVEMLAKAGALVGKRYGVAGIMGDRSFAGTTNQIEALPHKWGDLTSLTSSVPGVNGEDSTSPGGMRLGGASQNDIMKDGMRAMDTGNNAPMMNMNIETMGEMEVLAQGYKAGYGRFKDGIYSGSGVVKDGNIITSGICPVMARVSKGMVDGTPKLMDTLIADLKQVRP
jgi:hypothetical protein